MVKELYYNTISEIGSRLAEVIGREPRVERLPEAGHCSNVAQFDTRVRK